MYLSNGARRKRVPRSGLGYISHLASKTVRDVQEDYDALIDGLPSGKARDLGKEVARLRMIKSVHEQAVMRKAADVSGTAHAKVIPFRLKSVAIPKD